MLLWGNRNLEKMRVHGLEPEDVQSAFEASDWATEPSKVDFRTIGEGTSLSGKLIRVIFAETADGPYPIEDIMNSTKRPTLIELEANFDEESAWAEKNDGPQVLGRLTRPGRPPKGAAIEPTQPHSLRVQASIWLAVTTKAKKAGLSVNQAAQLALLEWANR